MKSLIAASLLAFSVGAVHAAEPKTEFTQEERILIITSASALGVLSMCHATGLYESPILEDSIARHVALVMPAAMMGDPRLFEGSSRNFEFGASNGVYISPKFEEGKAPERVDIQVHDTEGCVAVERTILELRKPGGLLGTPAPDDSQGA